MQTNLAHPTFSAVAEAGSRQKTLTALVPVLLLLWGVLLRVAQYLHHRSLWFDEALLALNLLNRSYGSLLKPLDYNQGAPVAFLLLQRFVGIHLGFGEYALRLAPLVAGLLGLYFFYKVAQLTLTPTALWIAVGLASFCQHLVYYASEVKQYSTDFLVLILLFYVLTLFVIRPASRSIAVSLTLAGALAVWISHPAIMALAGGGMAALLVLLRRRERSKAMAFAIAALAWLASASACYWFSIREIAQNHFLYLYWASGFMPHNLVSLSTWRWLVSHLFVMFKNPGGMLAAPAAIAFVCGCVVLYRRCKDLLLLLVGPMLVAIALSYLGKYPFEGRLLLFLTPAMFLLIAEGVNALTSHSRRLIVILGYTLAVLVLAQPVATSMKYLIRPVRRPQEEIRDVLQYVKARSQATDVCYIYHWATFQYRYYSAVYQLGCDNAMLGAQHIDTPNDYKVELDQLRGNRRAWLIFSHSQFGEEDFISMYARKIGRLIDSYHSFNASAYLFDLSR